MDCCNIMQFIQWMNLLENQARSCLLSTDPPTNLTLLMDTEATEGQLVTISCTVESFPWSHLKLMRTSTSNPRSHNWLHSFQDQQPNTLQHTFNVTSTHTGFYTCVATNSEGSNEEGRNFVVKCKWFSAALSFLLIKQIISKVSIKMLSFNLSTKRKKTTWF